MRTTVSTRGHVFLPATLRRRLGIRAGDPLDANIEAGRIVLTPRKARRLWVRIIKDPVTGLSALTAGPGAPVLTSKQVEDILADFP